MNTSILFYFHKLILLKLLQLLYVSYFRYKAWFNPTNSPSYRQPQIYSPCWVKEMSYWSAVSRIPSYKRHKEICKLWEWVYPRNDWFYLPFFIRWPSRSPDLSPMDLFFNYGCFEADFLKKNYFRWWKRATATVSQRKSLRKSAGICWRDGRRTGRF